MALNDCFIWNEFLFNWKIVQACDPCQPDNLKNLKNCLQSIRGTHLVKNLRIFPAGSWGKLSNPCVSWISWSRISPHDWLWQAIYAFHGQSVSWSWISPHDRLWQAIRVFHGFISSFYEQCADRRESASFMFQLEFDFIFLQCFTPLSLTFVFVTR